MNLSKFSKILSLFIFAFLFYQNSNAAVWTWNNATQRCYVSGYNIPAPSVYNFVDVCTMTSSYNYGNGYMSAIGQPAYFETSGISGTRVTSWFYAPDANNHYVKYDTRNFIIPSDSRGDAARQKLITDWGPEGNYIGPFPDHVLTQAECSAWPPNCDDEAAQLTATCGGSELVAWEWTDASTCTGRCLPCSPSKIQEGQETYQEAITRCTEQQQTLVHFDENVCLGVCSNCTTEQYLTEKDKCGPLRFTFNNVTCAALCDYKCTPEFAKGAADIYCSAENNKAISYTCSASVERGYYLVDGSVTCGNPDELTQLPNTTEPGEEKPADPSEPDPTAPAPDPTDPTDNNQWNQAIKSDLDKLIGQNDKLSADNKKQEVLLDWIGDNAKTTADNTNAIAKSLQDGSAKVSLDSQSLGALNGIEEGIDNLEGALNGVEGGIGSLEGTLEGIADGTYNQSLGPGPYTVPEHNFSERTNQFLLDLKQTSLFSIPSSLYQSIPSGGDSRVVIDTGSTFGGNHTVDFNYLSEALTILKYIFQIAGITIAIRIVTLKR